MPLQIKYASIDEINKMLSWAAKEGWNPGIEDVRSYYLIDPMGFYVGYYQGKLAACISRVQYSPEYSFVGFYIVHPDYRGKDFGYKMASRLLFRNRAQNMGADGVASLIDRYSKIGFKLAHYNERYVLDSANVSIEKNHFIFPVSMIPLKELAEYDRVFFPENRYSFLLSWLTQAQTKTLVYYDNGVKGYGAIRPAITGYRIGPLFANTSEIAAELFRHLCAFHNNSSIYIDAPTCNERAVEFYTQIGMSPIFKTGRMYSRDIPDISLDRTYGLTSLEVG